MTVRISNGNKAGIIQAGKIKNKYSADKAQSANSFIDLRKALGSHIKVFWMDELVTNIFLRDKLVLVKRYDKSPVKQIFPKNRMTYSEFVDILSSRCWESENADMQRILQANDLKEYSIPYVIKKTHGVSYNDPLWFEFENENLSARDVLIKENLYV